MRVKHPPMPPQTPPQQQAHGPATNGSQQAQQLEYLRRFRTLQQSNQSGAKRGGKGSKRTGSHEPMLLTDLDEVLNEAYEHLLGQRNRHQGRRDEEEANGDEEENQQDDKKFAAFRVQPNKLRG